MKKVTIKSVQELFCSINQMKRESYSLSQNQEFEKADVLNKKVEVLESKIAKLPTVCVSYFIGFRSYYSEVVKIGKTLLHRGEKMTQARGYRCIEEIPEITDEMVESMVSDSYYY